MTMLVTVMIVIMVVVRVTMMVMVMWKVSRKRRIEFEYPVQFCPLYIKRIDKNVSKGTNDIQYPRK